MIVILVNTTIYIPVEDYSFPAERKSPYRTLLLLSYSCVTIKRFTYEYGSALCQ